MSHGCVLVLLVVLATVPLGARPQQDHQRTFETATTAVVVDVVVRDRRGNPVTDLRKEDLELLEDGVRQEIADLTLVAPAATSKGAAPPVPAPDAALPPSTTVPTPTFVALAFDRLSPEGRALAHKGALAYLETARENDFAGVFVVDNRLEMVETFTNDRTALRHAIDAAASRATANFSRQNDRVRSSDMGETAANTPPTAGSQSGGQRFGRRLTTPSGQRDPNLPRGDAFIEAEANQERITNQMERSYESMMRDQQGFASTNALLALLDGLGAMPGRKTVVLFAEGLAIPAAVQARFDSVVTAANKANVSICRRCGGSPGSQPDGRNGTRRSGGRGHEPGPREPRRLRGRRVHEGARDHRGLAWEAPALALFDRPTRPRDIPIRVGVLTFPMTVNESRVPLLVGVPGNRVAFEVTCSFRISSRSSGSARLAASRLTTTGGAARQRTAPVVIRARIRGVPAI